MFIFKSNIRKVINLETKNEYYLTDLEADLLLLLSDNKYHSYEDIANYIYKYYNRKLIRNISCLKHRLESHTKFNLKVRLIRNRGYILEQEILIE